MTEDEAIESAKRLLDFGMILGIPTETWANNENLERIKFSMPGLERNKAINLNLDHIRPLLQAYGDALACKFRMDEQIVLSISAKLSQNDLDKFAEDTRYSPTVIFDFALEKAQLTRTWLGEIQGIRLFLYLFPEAFECFLKGSLKEIESSLWSSQTAYKVILLVPNRDIRQDGPYLAILGGAQASHSWRETIPPEPLDTKRFELVHQVYQTCRENLKWHYPWFEHLTPLHLKLEGKGLPNDPILNALQIHLINSILIYTADRTVGEIDKPQRAIYAGNAQSVEINLAEPSTLISEDNLLGIPALVKMLEWAYEPLSADRLSLLQIGVIKGTSAVDSQIRYQILIENSARIFDDLKWSWKAFIEGKIDSYVTEVKALEDYINETANTFADQIDTMIKSLSDTMLAAIGVLLGTFIASLFSDKFNPAIFELGMITYSIYVLIFPLGFTMYNKWTTFNNLAKRFEIRRKRFDERLYSENVDNIIGTQIKDSQELFKWWFRTISYAYVLFIILALFAAIHVPEFIQQASLSSGLASNHSPLV